MVWVGTMNKLIRIIDQFSNRKILVIGDVMLDRYISGNVARISPEAPVQIVDVRKEDFFPGGAANVSSNISSLGGTAYTVGIVGDDGASEILNEALEQRGISPDYLITNREKPTIQKMRIIAHHQQLLRVDYEINGGMDNPIYENIMDTIKRLIPQTDLIVISDYRKNMITKRIVRNVVKIAGKKKYIIVDPKPDNMDLYHGCSLITPNQNEASGITRINYKTEDDIILMGKALVAKLDSDVLVTRGEKGMSLFMKDGTQKNIPTKAKEVYDVTGAGDTVVATLALALSSGSSLGDAAVIANHAAGIVVSKIGTSTASIQELKKELLNDDYESG